MYKQAIEVQMAVYEAAIDPDTTASARAQLARAFKELGEFRLRLKMKPAPKPVDVSVPQRNGRARAAAEFQEQPAATKPDPKP